MNTPRVTVRKVDGEYQVRVIGTNGRAIEARTYFTDDRDDAAATANKMIEALAVEFASGQFDQVESERFNCLYLNDDAWQPARIVRIYTTKRGAPMNEVDFGGLRNVHLRDSSTRLIVNTTAR